MRPGSLLFFASLVAGLPRTVLAQRSCEGLRDLALPGASVITAATVPAGAFTIPSASPSPVPLPAYCRVEAVARPTGDSEITFEVWLPLGGVWNGKFQQIGNGGYAGSIMPAALASGVARGYATAATDNGHSLYRTTSRPFDRPPSGKIAIKVINHYGDEVLKVFDLGPSRVPPATSEGQPEFRGRPL